MTNKNQTRPKRKADARRVALGVLDDVLERKLEFDRAFDDARDVSLLEPRDRAFARLLLLTTFRRLGQIDAIISSFLQKEPKGKGRWVRSVLRLTTAQLVFLDTPPHAAVSSALKLLEILKLDQFKGLANAVLRKISTEGKAIAETQDAGQLNTPKWLYKRWQKAYGAELTTAIANMHMREANLDITVKTDAPGWAGKLDGQLLPTGSIRLKGISDVSTLPGFDTGDWWVQDTAASLPIHLLGDIKGKTIIDLCAAPGGKTLQLAAAGANVIAVDRSKRRMHRLRENLERTNLNAEIIVADALEYRPAELADAILLDAPCSSTGTIRRHPDLPHQKNLKDVQRLAELQQELLEAAVQMVKPGGVIIYATCSLQPEEGETRIRYFLKNSEQASLSAIKTEDVFGCDELITDNFLRCLPCHLTEQGGMDGFFAARLIKNEA